MALIFKGKASELVGRRYDPDYVRFRRRQKCFRYPAVALGKLTSARPEYGAAESGVERVDSSQVRYVRITDIDEHGVLSSDLGATVENVESRYLLDNGDVLFARSGNTVGKCYCHDSSLVGYPCIYAGYMIRFRFVQDVLPKFVFAFAQTTYFHEWVSAVRRAAGQPNINAQEYSDLEIPLPPLSVQRRLVAELDAAYAAKRIADQRAATLLASIDEMVLDRLEMTDFKVKDGSLRSRLFHVDLRQLQGTTLSPSHYYQQIDFTVSTYSCLRICDVVEIDPPNHEIISETFDFVPMEQVSSEWGEIECIESRIGTKDGLSTFRRGDVIFAKITPCMENGKSAVVQSNTFDAILGSSEFMVFRVVNHALMPEYLHLLLRLRLFRIVAANHFTGSAGHQRVDKQFISQLLIPIPPKDIQQRIVGEANKIKANAKCLKAHAVGQLDEVKKRIQEELMGNSNV